VTTRADMLFSAEMSVRYHRRRASFLELVGAVASLVTVIGGAGAFLTLLGGDSTLVAKIATFLLTFVGTVQLVFKTDTAAAAHRQWLKQWSRMLQEIKTNDKPRPSDIAAWLAERYAIEADCVTELRALQVDCYNRTVKALNLADDHLLKVRWYHRRLIHVWSFEGDFA
jgi:hypothetical protein